MQDPLHEDPATVPHQRGLRMSPRLQSTFPPPASSFWASARCCASSSHIGGCGERLSTIFPCLIKPQPLFFGLKPKKKKATGCLGSVPVLAALRHTAPGISPAGGFSTCWQNCSQSMVGSASNARCWFWRLRGCKTAGARQVGLTFPGPKSSPA